MDRSTAHRKGGTTAFLVTARDVKMSLGEHARGGTIVISPSSEQTQAWFKFDPSIEFSQCAPPAPVKPKGAKSSVVSPA